MTIKPLDFTELCTRYNPAGSSYDDLLSISTNSLYSRYTGSNLSLCSSAGSCSSVSTDISSFYDLPSRGRERYQHSPAAYRKRYEPSPKRHYLDGYESSPETRYQPSPENYDMREPPPRYGTPLSFQAPPSYSIPAPRYASSCTDIPLRCGTDAVEYDVPRRRGVSKRPIRDLPHKRSVQDLPSTRQQRPFTLDLSTTSNISNNRQFSSGSLTSSHQNIYQNISISNQNIYENVSSCQNIYQNISDLSPIYQNVPPKRNTPKVRKNSLPAQLEFGLRKNPSKDSLCSRQKLSQTHSVSYCDISKPRSSFSFSKPDLLKLEAELSNRNRVRDLDEIGSCCSGSGVSRDEAVSLDSGIPLTSEDIECRTPEMVADMYQQTSALRVIEEEKRRLQLIEDAGPYMGTLTRRDKRRRQDIRQQEFRQSTQDSLNFGSYSPSSQTCSLKRANTVCSSDVNTYLRNKCNRESVLSQGSEMSFKRHSKSTFDSGFESGLGDILDEILGATVYDPVFEDSEMPKTKWQNFKERITDAFVVNPKRSDIPDNLSDESDIKVTKWDKLQKFVKIKLAKISQHDLDMGGFEDEHWRSLEPRQFHRGTRRTQSMVKWKGRHAR